MQCVPGKRPTAIRSPAATSLRIHSSRFVRGSPGHCATMLRVRRTLPATTDSIKQLRSLAVAYALENCEPDDQLLGDLALAVPEAAPNVAHHPSHSHPEPGPVEPAAHHPAPHLTLRIPDRGGRRRAATPPPPRPTHP